jgi:antirestriction protein ArdC
MRNLRSYPTQRRDHYQELTDKIIAALEAGVVAWRRPWDPTACGGSNMPVNVATDHRYRGVNLFLLSMSPLAFTSGDPRWCSYRQAAARGWQVRKGERATPVYFYKPIEIEDKTTGGGSEKRRIPMLRTFSVFHASQIDGVPALAPPTAMKTVPSASRTRSSSLRRAACRFGLVVNAPFTTGRLTSSKCLRTKPFTVRNNEPSSSCTSSPTPAVIPRD